MADPARPSWLERTVVPEFLRFMLCPASLLHASQGYPGLGLADGSWLGQRVDGPVSAWPSAVRPDRIQRHLSSWILRSLREDESYTDRLVDPALPVFMPPRALFERLILHCGLSVLSPFIRRIITREEIQALRAELSVDAWNFIHSERSRLWLPGPADGLELQFGQVHAQANQLGGEVLFCAAVMASPAVASRARLRLSRSIDLQSLKLPATLRAAEAALSLSRGALQVLDPEWIALFPDSR